MFADLHLHTFFSDGTYSPEELASHAKAKELSVVSLTDHDTVEGCPRMAAACESFGLEFIPGVELTVEFQDHELHLLAYYVDIENASLLGELDRYQKVRQERIREMVGRLNDMDVRIKAESVFELANCNAPGRPHIARTLVKEGVCSSLDAAFEKYLKRNRPAWVPKSKMSAEDAIHLVHQAGGAAVLAHPGLNRCDDLIPQLVEHGLDGIECVHSRHSTTAMEHYLDLAENSNLLITGGSDCHGMNKGQPLIGTVKLPYAFVAKLKARVKRLAGGGPASAS